MRDIRFRLLFLLVFLGCGYKSSVSAQVLPLQVQQVYNELSGQHHIEIEDNLIIINIKVLDSLSEKLIRKEPNYLSFSGISPLQIMKIIYNKLTFEGCNEGNICVFRSVKGEPHLFTDINDDKLIYLQSLRLNLEANCENCEVSHLNGAILKQLYSVFDLETQYLSVPVYEVCQDYSGFLAHFHSGESPFPDNHFNIQTRTELHGDEVLIYNTTLPDALSFFSSEMRILVRNNDSCKNYSRVYTKPFRIKRFGSLEEKIQHFEESNYVDLELVEEESWEALLIKSL